MPNMTLVGDGEDHAARQLFVMLKNFEMKRPLIIWIISLGLMLNGIYQFVIVAQSSYYTSVAAWGILSFAGAIGLLLERQWSKYLILLVSLFSLTCWIDGTIRAFQNGPPYGTLRDNILSFVPALFLISWWICISLYVLKYFNNIKKAIAAPDAAPPRRRAWRSTPNKA